MILIPLKRVHLQLVQRGRRSIEQPAVLDDLLEKQRVGAVDHRHVDIAVRYEGLKVGRELGMRIQRVRAPLQQHREVDVAGRVRAPRHRRSNCNSSRIPCRRATSERRSESIGPDYRPVDHRARPRRVPGPAG